MTLERSFQFGKSSKLYAFKKCSVENVPTAPLQVLRCGNHFVTSFPSDGAVLQAFVESENAQPKSKSVVRTKLVRRD